MDPIDRSENLHALYAATDLVVEISGEATYRELMNEWETHWKDKYQWINLGQQSFESWNASVSHQRKTFQVKCDFVKINHCVLMLFQPHGDIAMNISMQTQVHKWLKNTSWRSTHTSGMFQELEIWDDIRNNRDQNKIIFPFGARSAIYVENEYDFSRCIAALQRHCSENNFTCTRFKKSYLREYPIERTQIEMRIRKEVHLINGFVVTFLHNIDDCEDSDALYEKAREWFPSAKLILLKSWLPELLRLMANPGFDPRGCPEPTAPPVGKDDIPDVVVSAYPLQVNIGPLGARYLEPRAALVRDRIFPLIRDKIGNSGRKFKAEFQQFSVVVYTFSGGSMRVTFRENGSDEYVSCFDNGPMSYYGNLPNLVNLLDVMVQHCNIEKFIELEG